jgi:hypothetical protein
MCRENPPKFELKFKCEQTEILPTRPESKVMTQIVSNVWCLTKVIAFDPGRVGRIQEYVRNARAGLVQMLEPHG